MNCKKIRGLILTDYLDGRMDKTQKETLNEHLKGCPACREFEALSRKLVMEPFDKVPRPQPPALVWQRIRETLEPQKRKPVFNPLGEGILRLFNLPKSVFALSSVLTVFLIAVVLTRTPRFFKDLENRHLARTYLEEEIDIFSGNGLTTLEETNGDFDNYLL